jgi:outer membrane receptor protein involved in Fe transport
VPNANANLTAGVDVDYSPGSYIEWGISATKTGSIYDSYSKGATLYDYDVTFHGVSPWIQAEYSPVDRLHLSAGVRGDFLGYDYTNALGVETTGSHRRPADASPTFSAVSPKVGFTVVATDDLDLFASYRRGFRAPDQGQLFRQGSATNTVGLDPVKADSWETGFRGEIVQRVRYEASLYYMTMKDDILGYRLPDGTTLSVNAGETLHKGVEVGLGAEIVRGLGFDLAYSYAEHTYEDWRPDSLTNYSGKEQEAAPRQIGSGRIHIAPPALRGSDLTLEWNRVGSYFTDAANTHEYEGHDLFSIRAAYEVTPRFSVYGKLNNVFDERWADRVSYNAFRGQEYAPGLPRTVYLGLSVR